MAAKTKYYLKLPTPLNKGLSSYQLKIIALAFMTLGHIVMTWDILIPFVAENRFILEGISRFSAFLFLYTAVDGSHYTRSKTKLLTRLYLAGLILASINLVLRENGVFANFNIFYSIFYTLLYCFLIEHLISSFKSKNVRSIVFSVIGICVTLLPQYINQFASSGISDVIPNLSIDTRFLIVKVTEAVFADPLTVEYGVLYILIGVLWYFIRDRRWQCVMLTLLSVGSFIGNYYSNLIGETLGGEAFYAIFLDGQYLMVFAIPFILLYNGERGRRSKWFFYLYYPIHYHIIIFIAHFLSA